MPRDCRPGKTSQNYRRSGYSRHCQVDYTRCEEQPNGEVPADRAHSPLSILRHASPDRPAMRLRPYSHNPPPINPHLFPLHLHSLRMPYPDFWQLPPASPRNDRYKHNLHLCTAIRRYRAQTRRALAVPYKRVRHVNLHDEARHGLRRVRVVDCQCEGERTLVLDRVGMRDAGGEEGVLGR